MACAAVCGSASVKSLDGVPADNGWTCTNPTCAQPASGRRAQTIVWCEDMLRAQDCAGSVERAYACVKGTAELFQALMPFMGLSMH